MSDTVMTIIFMSMIVWGIYRSLTRTIAELSLRVEGLEARVRRLQSEGPVTTAAPPPAPAEPKPSPTPPEIRPQPAEPPQVAKPAPPSRPALPVKPPAPRAPTPPSTPRTTPGMAIPAIDWENFMGVKFFAWLGGFAMFLAAVLFVKYSIEHNLISPALRVAIGYVFGAGLIVGGLLLRKKGYGVTVETLCSAGVAILYADVFASRAMYNFISAEVGFLFMILVTVTAFFLAVRLDSKYVAILGLIGGFLTPPLLSTGEDRPVALFLYIALLDTGLVAVALRQRWGFLVNMSFIATLLMEYGWTMNFFSVSKANLATVIYLSFTAFYLALSEVARRRGENGRAFHEPAGYMALLSMGFVFYMLTINALGARPGLVLTLLLLLSAQLAYLALRQDALRKLHLTGGIVAFLLLGAWTVGFLTPERLPWALAYYMGFAVLHAAFPIVLQRLRPAARPFLMGNIFPLLMLSLIMIGMTIGDKLSFMVWPFILLIGLVATTGAVLAGMLRLAMAALAFTMAPFALWFVYMTDVTGLTSILPVLGFFSLVFFAGGIFLSRGISAGGPGATESIDPQRATQLSALSALGPFVLLAMACTKLPVKNPSEIFGLMALLNLLLLELVRYRATDLLAPVALISTSFVEVVWHFGHFQSKVNDGVLGWYVLFYAVFAVFPFIYQNRLQGLGAWAASALSGPIHFFLIYRVVTATWGNSMIGLLPIPFAAVSLLGLRRILRTVPAEDERRGTQLALFGGVALFFITLILPLQFENEWLTLGWALEGLALIWLFRRVPHQGLKGWGLALLAIAFVRLALNPAVLSYHPRASAPVFNWYLYTYGVTAVCLLLAARRLTPPENKWGELELPPILNTLGVVLTFLLLNIEIADYFSTGTSLTFQFSGHLAQDMAYSLGWALFAFGLLMIGIRVGSRGARLGGIGLLVVTIVKVFLHDLWRLGQLYRVASIFGLAAILILVSFFYQRYLASEKKEG